MSELSFNCSDCGGEHSINEALVNKVANRLIEEAETLIEDGEIMTVNKAENPGVERIENPVVIDESELHNLAVNAGEKDDLADYIIANCSEWTEEDRTELRATPVSVLEDLKSSEQSKTRSANFSPIGSGSANLSSGNDSSGVALRASERMKQIEEEAEEN